MRRVTRDGLRMLSAPARGDRPATTTGRWIPSSPSSSRRPSTTCMAEARRLRRGTLVTYSPKVFIPLTTLCRDVCGYCTFARPPRRGERAYLTEDEVLEIARAGAAAGCTEALFTLGDKPELRYRVARDELAALGCATTLEYLGALRTLVLDETGLLPHLNPGVMTRDELARCARWRRRWGSCSRRRPSGSRRGVGRTGPRRTSCPARRLETIRLAGELRDPVHERDPDRDRRDARGADRRAARAPRRCASEHGHLQEVIVQNFRAKPGTRMADASRRRRSTTTSGRSRSRGSSSARTSTCRRRRTSRTTTSRCCSTPASTTGAGSRRSRRPRQPRGAVAGGRAAARGDCARAVSSSRRGCRSTPSTSPTSSAGSTRRSRPAIRRAPTRSGLAREDGWAPGEPVAVPFIVASRCAPLELAGDELGEDELARLFDGARRGARARLRRCRPAAPRGVRRRGQLRRHAEHPVHERLLLPVRLLRVLEGQARGEPARAGLPRPARRDRPPRRARRGSAARPRCASRAGSTRRSPATTTRASSRRSRTRCRGSTSTRSRRSRSGRVRRRSGSPLDDYLARLRELGLGSLPGTAAEILDDEVRAVICPDKVTTAQWLEVHDAAHRVGLRSNVTIMFGHVERPEHWARHLLRAREQQAAHRAGSPSSCRCRSCRWRRRSTSRAGPAAGRRSARRCSMHAVARLALHPLDHEHPGALGEARPRRRRGRRSPRASTTSAGR